MTQEQQIILDSLRDNEVILSQSYWENFKYHKEISQGMGFNNPKVKRIAAECENIRRDWQICEMKIKEFLKAIGEKE